ncbi:MAG: TolB family protein [Chloroflexota bacterium]
MSRIIARVLAPLLLLCLVPLLIVPGLRPLYGAVLVTVGQDARQGQEITLLDARHRLRVRLPGTPGTDADPVWSPDGQQVAFASDYGPRVGHLYIGAPGQPARLVAAVDGLIYRPRWSPDGDTIAFISEETGLSFVYTADPNATIPSGTSLPPPAQRHYGAAGVLAQSLQWVPGSDALLVVTTWHGGRIQPVRIPLDGSDAEPIDLPAIAAAYSPDGGWFYYATRDLYRVPVAMLGHTDARPEQLTTDYFVQTFSISPDETLVAFTAGPGTSMLPVLRVLDLDSGTVYTLTGRDGQPVATRAFSSLEWSPDSRWIVYQVGGDLYVASLDRVRRLTVDQALFNVVTFDWRPMQ